MGGLSRDQLQAQLDADAAEEATAKHRGGNPARTRPETAEENPERMAKHSRTLVQARAESPEKAAKTPAPAACVQVAGIPPAGSKWEAVLENFDTVLLDAFPPGPFLIELPEGALEDTPPKLNRRIKALRERSLDGSRVFSLVGDAVLIGRVGGDDLGDDAHSSSPSPMTDHSQTRARWS